MTKQKIGAREVVKDIKSGISDAELMSKYDLSPKGLESLFQKLIQAKLLDESLIRQRAAGAKKTERSTKPLQPPAPPVGAPSGAEPQSDLALAVLQDIKAGRHDNQIMRSHELSPGQLKQMKADLAQSGLLVEPSSGPPKPKETRLCPTCSEEVDASAEECPNCGRWLEPELSPGPKPGMPSHPPAGVVSHEDRARGEAVEEDKECPWEDRESYGTLNAYFQTATKLIWSPTSFFAKLPTSGGYLNPILFAAISFPIAVVLTYLWIGLFSSTGFVGLIGVLIAMSCTFVAALITVPIALVIWSGLLHLCLHFMGSVREGFEATFRVVSYSSMTTIFSAVPVIGNIAGAVWGLVLNVIGLRETHKTTTGKAAAAVAIPVVVIMVFGLVLGLLSGGLFGGSSVPKQACYSVETYIARVDGAASLDADARDREVQAAMRELIQDLAAFRGQHGVAALQQKAMLFGVASIQQAKTGAKFGKGVDQLRDDLRKSCK